VQFNTTHIKKNASSTLWIAVFPCVITSPAGNASDLVSNAHKTYWDSIPFHRGAVGSKTSPHLRKIVSPQAESFVAESFFPMGLVDIESPPYSIHHALGVLRLRSLVLTCVPARTYAFVSYERTVRRHPVAHYLPMSPTCGCGRRLLGSVRSK
jgi:hypothetical protein